MANTEESNNQISEPPLVLSINLGKDDTRLAHLSYHQRRILIKFFIVLDDFFVIWLWWSWQKF